MRAIGKKEGKGKADSSCWGSPGVKISGETGYPRVKKFLKYEIARKKNFV